MRWFKSFKIENLSFIIPFLFFLIPFENVAVAVAHKILGPFFFLLHPTFFILLLAGWSFRKEFKSIDKMFLVFISGFVVSSIYNKSDWQDAGSFIFLFVVSYLSVRYLKKEKFIKYLIAGQMVAAVCIVALYIHYNHTIYATLGFDAPALDYILIYNRYIDNIPDIIKQTTYFHFFIGNTNKASNLVLLYSLLIVYAYKKKVLSSIFAYSSLCLMIVLQIVFFSRGALMIQFLSGVAIFTSDFYFKKKEAQKLSLLFLLPFFLSLSTQLFRDYWQNKATIDIRIEQQKSLFDVGSRLSVNETIADYVGRLFLGYGPGGYGKKFYKSSHAGTHNFFIDTYLAGGVVSLVSIFAILFWPVLMLCKGIKNQFKEYDETFILKGLLIFTTATLAVRELDFIYLFKLSQYGFIFFFMYFLMFDFNSSKIKVYSSL